MGENGYVERPDFEEPRLDVQGFVVDYFEWRISEDENVWHESPGLPEGVQPEHLAMRKVAAIFERRHRDELKTFLEDIINDESLSFPRYCDVLDEFGRVEHDKAEQMSFGRLVGVMSFGGFAAARMTELGQRRQVQQIALYTARFIDSRIKLTWAKDELSWVKFMGLAKNIIQRDDRMQAEERRKAAETKKRRWSFGVLIGAVVLGAGVVGARTMLSK